MKKQRIVCGRRKQKYQFYVFAMSFFCLFFFYALQGIFKYKEKVTREDPFFFFKCTHTFVHLSLHIYVCICFISNVMFCINFSIYPLHYVDIRLASTISTTPAGRLEAANCWCSPWCSFYLKKTTPKHCCSVFNLKTVKIISL